MPVIYSQEPVLTGFGQFRFANVKRCQDAFHPVDSWTPSDWMTAVAGEIGEAANLIKKLRLGEDVSKTALAHELADAVTYIDLLADRLGIDLGAALVDKFNIVSERVGSTVRFAPVEP